MIEIKSKHECLLCRINHTVGAIESEYDVWRFSSQGFIRDLMPSMSVDDREILISGQCNASFKNLFGEED